MTQARTVVTLQVRRGTNTEWNSADPILAVGELGYNTTSGKFKIGDGTSHWTVLGYSAVTPGELTELAQDAVAALILDGDNVGISVSYDDVANKFSFTVGDQFPSHTTDDLEEGNANKYFTDLRAQTAVASDISEAISNAALGSTDDLSEGTTNLYFTAERAKSAVASDISTAVADLVDSAPALLNTLNELAAAINDDENFAVTVATNITNAIDNLDTDAIEEGTANKYFTDERAQDAVGNSVGTGLTYTDSSGEIKIDNTVVATLSDSQTLSSKTLHNPELDLTLSETLTISNPGQTSTYSASGSTVYGSIVATGPYPLYGFHYEDNSIIIGPNGQNEWWGTEWLGSTWTFQEYPNLAFAGHVDMRNAQWQQQGYFTIAEAVALGYLVFTPTHVEYTCTVGDSLNGQTCTHVDSPSVISHVSGNFYRITLPTTAGYNAAANNGFAGLTFSSNVYTGLLVGSSQDGTDILVEFAEDPEVSFPNGTVITVTLLKNISSVELGYLNNVTSDIQPQLNSKFNTADASTTHISEGTNLYFTGERAQIAVAQDIANAISNAALGSTDDLSEGTTNLYFTDERAQSAVAQDISTAISTAFSGYTNSRKVTAVTTSELVGSYNSQAKTFTLNAYAPLVVDGYTTALSDVLLLKDQTTSSQNGVYEVTTAGQSTTTTYSPTVVTSTQYQYPETHWTTYGQMASEGSTAGLVAYTYWNGGQGYTCTASGNAPFSLLSNDNYNHDFYCPNGGSTTTIYTPTCPSGGTYDSGTGNCVVVVTSAQAVLTRLAEFDTPEKLDGQTFFAESGSTLISTVWLTDNQSNNIVVKKMTPLTEGEITTLITDSISNAALGSTDDLTEGASNLYFTTERAQDAVGNSLGNGLKYTDSTGVIEPDLALSGGLYIEPGNKLAVDGYYVTFNGAVQTLTNKTFTSPKVNEDVVLTATATELNVLDGATLSTTELNYVDGVTSAIQTQLNAKAPLVAPNFTGNATAENVFISGDLTVSGTTTTVNTQTLAVEDNLFYLNAELDRNILSATHNGNTVEYEVDSLSGVTQGESVRVTDVTPSAYNISASDAVTVASVRTSGSKHYFTVTKTVSVAYVSGGVAHFKKATNVDLGFAGGYNDGSYKHAGLFRDASDSGKWKFFEGYVPEPDEAVNIDTGDTSFALASLKIAGFEANSATIGNVSNTELQYLDGVTSAIQTQLNSKLASSTAASTYAPIASPTFTGTVSGITKSMVGLANVDNTSDVNKPVSTAAQTALDLKANLDSPTFTGTVTLPSGTVTNGMLAGSIANTKLVNSKVTLGSTDVSLGTTATTLTGFSSISSTSFTGALTGNASTATKLAATKNINGIAFDGSADITVTADATTLTGTSLKSTVVGSSLTSVGTITTGVWNGSVINASYIDTAIARLAGPTFTGTVSAPTPTTGDDSTKVATTAYVQANNLVQYVTVSGTSATIDSTAQKFKVIVCTSSSPVTISIPTDASDNWPIGSYVNVRQMGTGQVTVSAVTPATTTVVATDSQLKTRVQYSEIVLEKTAANTWLVAGDTTA